MVLHKQVSFELSQNGRLLKQSAAASEIVATLGDESFLGRVRSLDVSHIDFDGGVVGENGGKKLGVSLAEALATKMKKLRRLTLEGCNLSETAIYAIAKAAAKSRVEDLDMSCNAKISGRTIISQFCTQIAAFNHLQQLQIRNCALGAEAFAEIMKAGRRCGLLRLSLSKNNIYKGDEDSFSRACGELSCSNNLQQLDVSHCNLPGSAITAIAEAVVSIGCGLRVLNVAGNTSLSSSDVISEFSLHISRSCRLHLLEAIDCGLAESQLATLKLMLKKHLPNAELISDERQR